MEGHAKIAPISRLPLITMLDTKDRLKDVPVCQVAIHCNLFVTFIITLKLVSDATCFIWKPFHLELNFFNKENRVLHYPVRAFYVDGANLMAYNVSSGADSTYKKLYTSVILKRLLSLLLESTRGIYLYGFCFQIPGNVEYHPKHLVYSKKQQIFLVVYEFSGTTNEVVMYQENSDSQLANSKCSTVKGTSICQSYFLFRC